MNQPEMTWEDAVRWLLDRPDKAELARAAYFDQPTSGAARRYHASPEFAALRGFLPKRGRALDLGAGNGILSYALAADGWRVTAVEPDPSDFIGAGAIRTLAEDTSVQIDVVEAMGEALPLETANYDVVVARQVLHHAADLGSFCAEMARLTRPGGAVITLRDHVISGPEQMQAFLDRHPLHHLYGGENAFTVEQYRSALTGAGLVIERELGSFDSVVNYAPLSEADIRKAMADAAPKPLRFASRAVAAALPFPIVLKLATAADRRPGKLVSFVARKPQAAG